MSCSKHGSLSFPENVHLEIYNKNPLHIYMHDRLVQKVASKNKLNILKENDQMYDFSYEIRWGPGVINFHI